ncbi:SH3 domain-containing protein [Pelistega ratti]|uniref:SH3 domain-containing protein n=1 Tax=Pelistega ratti TaxID=2652177 RepID=UPI001359E9DA|nr:SH3 domain-containing protein [Pelistega ratti]
MLSKKLLLSAIILSIGLVGCKTLEDFFGYNKQGNYAETYQGTQIERVQLYSKDPNGRAVYYKTLKSSNVRSGPRKTATIVGGLPAGQRFLVAGYTKDNWVAVESRGRIVGYVHGSLVRELSAAELKAPNKTHKANTKANNKTKKEEGEDIDAILTKETKEEGVNLDEL